MQPGEHHESNSSLPPPYRSIDTGPPEYGLPPTYISSLEHYHERDGIPTLNRVFGSTASVWIMPVELGLLKVGAEVPVGVRVRPPRPPSGLRAMLYWFTRRYVKPQYVAIKLENLTSEGRWKGPEPMWNKEDAVDHYARRLRRPHRGGEEA